MRYLCSAYLSATHLYCAKDSFFSFYGDRLSGDIGLAHWFNVFVRKFLFLSMKEKTGDTFLIDDIEFMLSVGECLMIPPDFYNLSDVRRLGKPW